MVPRPAVALAALFFLGTTACSSCCCPGRGAPPGPAAATPARVVVTDVVNAPGAIRVLDVAEPAEIRATHVLIAYAGSKTPGATRPKDTARLLAQSMLDEVLAGRRLEDFLDKTDDRGPGGPNGGAGPGSYRFRRGVMVKPFEQAAFATPVGKVHPRVVETVFGFHLIRRDE
jgi:hypothetical protein